MGCAPFEQYDILSLAAGSQAISSDPPSKSCSRTSLSSTRSGEEVPSPRSQRWHAVLMSWSLNYLLSILSTTLDINEA